MKKAVKLLPLLLSSMMILTACGNETKTDTQQDTASVSTSFEPKLDTEKSTELHAAVFFGNFEALDQVINHFNDIYPNVTITYEQLNSSDDNFFANNPNIDIFMTSNEKGYPQENCVDLLEAGVDVSAVADGLLDSTTVDGKLLALPMGLKLRGLAVNKTLLEKEGLSVPQTWSEFTEVLDALKQKGYTPLQGPTNTVSQLFYDMGMTMMSQDSKLLQAVTEGDAAGAASLQTMYERLLELQEKGYMSEEINAEYPEDNYDGAILKFFEGDVPFWVCDTEKASGMKKRESKSETFSSSPFEYEFMFAPTGDNGVYEYIEPWYGFAVNKDSSVQDYAVEFLRFMAQQDELNTLASVKGVPSICKSSPDERYTALSNVEKVEASAIGNGTVPPYFGTLMCHTGNSLLSGEISDAGAAVSQFVSSIKDSQTGN